MNFLSLIENKREGKILTPEQIQEFIREFTAGKIPDYQMAAMLMAIYFRGLDAAETTALTLAMRDSGDVLKFPEDKRPLVDKHSTGGIGDKVSLPRADDFRPRPRYHRRHARQSGFHSRLQNAFARRANHRASPKSRLRHLRPDRQN